MQRSSPLSTPYRRFLNICATGFRFRGPWGADGVYESQESRCLTKLCGKNIAIPALLYVLDYQTTGEELEYYGLVTRQKVPGFDGIRVVANRNYNRPSKDCLHLN